MEKRANSFSMDRAKCVRIVNPNISRLGREDALEWVKEQACDFAYDFFMELDLPSAPVITLVAFDGFERTDVPFENVSGIFRFALKFSTASNHTVQLDFMFPYCRGYILTPTIAEFAKRKYVFSQGTLNDIVAKFQSVRPKLVNPLQPSFRVDHMNNVERPIFSAPNDPSGWSDLISERYI
jgi:hypothetical protein